MQSVEDGCAQFVSKNAIDQFVMGAACYRAC